MIREVVEPTLHMEWRMGQCAEPGCQHYGMVRGAHGSPRSYCKNHLPASAVTTAISSPLPGPDNSHSGPLVRVLYPNQVTRSREHMGMSMSAVATYSRIGLRAVKKIESGVPVPESVAQRFARAIGVELEWEEVA